MYVLRFVAEDRHEGSKVCSPCSLGGGGGGGGTRTLCIIGCLRKSLVAQWPYNNGHRRFGIACLCPGNSELAKGKRATLSGREGGGVRGREGGGGGEGGEGGEGEGGTDGGGA